MPYRKWEQVEQRFSKPMDDVLIDLYAKHGQTIAVAEDLGITVKGLMGWLDKAKLKTVPGRRAVRKIASGE